MNKYMSPHPSTNFELITSILCEPNDLDEALTPNTNKVEFCGKGAPDDECNMCNCPK